MRTPRKGSCRSREVAASVLARVGDGTGAVRAGHSQTASTTPSTSKSLASLRRRELAHPCVHFGGCTKHQPEKRGPLEGVAVQVVAFSFVFDSPHFAMSLSAVNDKGAPFASQAFGPCRSMRSELLWHRDRQVAEG